MDFFSLNDTTEKEPFDIFINNFKPTKNISTIAMVTFETDEGGTDLKGVGDRAIGYTYAIYRERNNDGHLELLYKIKEGTLGFYDYGIKNNAKYKYYIFKENQTDNTSSYANESDTVCSFWGNYVLYDLIDKVVENNIPIYSVDENNIWQFDLQMQNSGVIQNLNKTTYSTFGKYARTNRSNNNYASGSLSCLFGEASNFVYYEDSDKLEKWAEFINNGNMKLLKDIKGNAWIIDIIESNVKPDDNFLEIPSTLTFSWVQINSVLDKGFVSYD